MWYTVPSPPHIINGVEKGSATNQKYALRSDDEARAYLSFTADGQCLRDNYLAVMVVLRDQLAVGNLPIGGPDLPKLKSSIKYFRRISRDVGDKELRGATEEVVALWKNRQSLRSSCKDKRGARMPGFL